MLRMLLVVVAAVLAVRIIQNLFQSRRQETNVGGNPQRPRDSRRTNDIEDADFREIK
ncbi:MAG: hypothetical protein IPK53_14235 [bacterium]|nr:hypothetical protein [bacterium]MBK8130007.1 hypothetical protein [bacterium]